MRIANLFVAVAATTLMLVGCASQKEPAEKALAQVESSLAEFRADAEKYAAEELQGVDASIARLKSSLANKDYSAVVKAAPALNSTITSLRETVATKKADADAMLAAAQAEWTDLSAKVPQMVEAIQSRVDTLGKSRKLPANLDKAAWETVKTDFEAMKTEWTDATAQFASGQAGEAVRKAREVKAKGDQILGQLGMTPS
ncbi:MAG TPA: hypothetical protein VFU13_02210 [Steroidobacteraceae bacterium]|nr:hypothetical protein [Steroidobacteraceae bacterium]